MIEIVLFAIVLGGSDNQHRAQVVEGVGLAIITLAISDKGDSRG